MTSTKREDGTRVYSIARGEAYPPISLAFSFSQRDARQPHDGAGQLYRGDRDANSLNRVALSPTDSISFRAELISTAVAPNFSEASCGETSSVIAHIANCTASRLLEWAASIFAISSVAGPLTLRRSDVAGFSLSKLMQ